MWKARYKVSTPLFLGGADPNQMPELRPPSLKGVLRFWYRAVALASLGSWERVRESEQGLFGSTKGQSQILMRLSGPRKPSIQLSSIKTGIGTGYLGYGVIDRGKTVRPYIKPGIEFTLKLGIRAKADPESLELLKKALIAVGLFGGIGARSRRGFGSLAIQELHIGDQKWEAPRDLDEYVDRARELLDDVGTYAGLPPYTAFSKKSRVCVATVGESADRVLEDIGREMLRYRSYGHRREGQQHHVLPWGEQALQLFNVDHDLVAGYLSGNNPEIHPRRIVFGLPHNYFFLSTRKQVDVKTEKHSRRASPLFIHVHDFGNRSCAAVLTLLPAQFLPENDEIVFSCKQRDPVTVPVDVDYQVIHDFMDRFPENSRRDVWPC